MHFEKIMIIISNFIKAGTAVLKKNKSNLYGTRKSFNKNVHSFLYCERVFKWCYQNYVSIKKVSRDTKSLATTHHNHSAPPKKVKYSFRTNHPISQNFPIFEKTMPCVILGQCHPTFDYQILIQQSRNKSLSLHQVWVSKIYLFHLTSKSLIIMYHAIKAAIGETTSLVRHTAAKGASM